MRLVNDSKWTVGCCRLFSRSWHGKTEQTGVKVTPHFSVGAVFESWAGLPSVLTSFTCFPLFSVGLCGAVSEIGQDPAFYQIVFVPFHSIHS